MSEDERAIRDLIAAWMAATKEGDLPAVLDLMTDDVVFMVPGRAFGKDVFAAASKNLEPVRFEGESEVLEIEVLGDRAWCRTRLKVATVPAQGPAITRAGFTLSIFRKEADGRWRLARDANLLAPE